MKEQYVGDINDYVKYSVLRAIQAAQPSPLLVCWMLTHEDARADGLRTQYLADPDRYRDVDPHLFDELGRIVATGRRSTKNVESAGLLPGASFFRSYLKDALDAREDFLSALWGVARPRSVVFFDPDNGLDVRSTPVGRAGSARYVYCSELAPLADLGSAAVIYQHFPRVARQAYVEAQLTRLADALPGYTTMAIHGSNIALLIAAPAALEHGIRTALRTAAERWGNRLYVTLLA